MKIYQWVAALSTAMIVWSIALLPQPTSAAVGDTKTYISKLYWGDGQQAAVALFDFPEDIARTSKNELLIADTGNNVIRRINRDGTVETLVGTGSWGDTTGKRREIELASPSAVAEREGVIVFTELDSGKLKRVKGGIVTTLVAGLKQPRGVAIYGSTVYFTEAGKNTLKSVSINGGAVRTITSSLNAPRKFALSGDGKTAYVANTGSYQIKQVNIATGAVSNVAGTGKAGKKNGTCSQATLQNVGGVTRVGNDLYVTDGNGFTDMVRKIDLTGCTVSTFASDANMLSINFPQGLTTRDGVLYVASTGIGIIQRYQLNNANDNAVFAGANRFNVKDYNPVLVGQPKSLALSKDKKWIYVSENNRLRKIERSTKKIRLIAGSVVDNYVQGKDNQPRSGDRARFSDITSFAVSKDGESLYVVDRNNNRIREVIIATGEARYLTGAGYINLAGAQQNDYQDGGPCPDEYDIDQSGCAYLNRPTGSVLSKDGKYLYVSDSGNNRIRRVTVTGSDKGQVRTVAGSGAAGFRDDFGSKAQFKAPWGLALSTDGNTLFVADRDNHAIRAIVLSNRKVSTITSSAGAGGKLDGKLRDARFGLPMYITVDSKNKLYVSEVAASDIRKIDLSANSVSTIAGTSLKRGFANGNRDQARFNNAQGLLVLEDKYLLVADRLNDMIREVSLR